MPRKTIDQLRSDMCSRLAPDSAEPVTVEALRTIQTLRSLVVDFIDTMQPGYCAATPAAPTTRTIPSTAPAVLDIFDTLYQPLDDMFDWDGSGIVTLNSRAILRITIFLSAEYGPGAELRVAIAKDGVQTRWVTDSQGRGSGKPVTIALPSCLVEVEAGETISAIAQSESSDESVNFVEGGFVCEYVPMIDIAPADPGS